MTDRRMCKGLTRVREYISHINGILPTRPTMARVPDEDPDISDFLTPIVVQTLQASQELSMNIFNIEVDIQKIGDKLNTCSKETDRLTKLLQVSFILITA